MELGTLYGVGERMLELFKKLQIYTIEDLLTYYPFRYVVIRLSDIKDAVDGDTITIKGVVETEAQTRYVKRNFNRMTFKINTSDVLLNVTIFNRAFYKEQLTIGRMVIITGKYDKKKSSLVASEIHFDIFPHIKIEPVYHLMNGIKKASLVRVLTEALRMNVDFHDYIPDIIMKKYNFLDKKEACYILHKPQNLEELKKAKLRTIYEEFFLFMFKIQYLKQQYDLDNHGVSREVSFGDVENFIKNLPFVLTDDQYSSVLDIYHDLVSEKRMNRLLLGDVGSGKTLVAEISMYINHLSGYQSAMMAPTEILARQHYENMLSLFKDTDIKIGLFIGSMKKKEKDVVILGLNKGEISIVVGTHALLNEKLIFKNLGLVITDEQHRFGVMQRSILQNKGIMSDVLYMSATPIPRTYALTIYGDMDTSLIKTRPSGRRDIITKVVKEQNLKEVLFHMLKEIKMGHQIYVVAPLIEDEEDGAEVNDVVHLKEKFLMAFHNKIRIEILNGKMKAKDKEQVMEEFKNGDIQILISTTVIEVGVDVKNSTMMIIFNAERFGLATLHQLRGRVGRNSLQSYCYLVCNMDVERLKVMEESNDGFYISQRDFELRGEGDLFGTKQSGDMSFKLGDIRRDYKILEQAKKDVISFIEEQSSEHFNKYPEFKEIVEQLEFVN